MDAWGEPDGTGSDVLLAMERNLAGHASHLHRRTPGMRVFETASLLVSDSGIDDDTFNIVACARLSGDTADGVVAVTVERLVATGRRFSWWIGPASTPKDLSARLTEAGRPASDATTAMWADLRRVVHTADLLPDGLVVTPVTTRAELADYATILAANWDPPAESVRRFIEATAAAALSPVCRSRYVVGYHEGRPVACAEAYDGGGVVGLYNVCTLVADRRRGYGGALTVAALRLARAMGGETVVLQASAQGLPIYARLGFRTCGRYVEHAITP